MADFEDIAKGISCHFCSKCGASFECDDEEGCCDCPFSNYFGDAQCDSCVDAYLEEQEREEKEAAEREEDEEA